MEQSKNFQDILGMDAINIDEKQARAKRYLNDFIKYTMPEYETNWHHDLICKKLDKFLKDPDAKRLMLFVGPRRGKSEIVSRRLPAYCFGKNPNMKIIGTSYGAELAQDMNRDVQRVIDDDKYRELFPDTQLSGKNVKSTSFGNYVRTSDKFEIVGHKGAYRSAGVNGALTGTGADLALIDDPLKGMQDALSPTVKKAVFDWYRSVLLTRLSKVGKVIIILTRWAEDDLAGRLLKLAKTNPDADQWDVLCFPEMYDPEHPYAYPQDPRTEPGELLWPDWFPDAKTTKATVGSKVWASLFQQKPAPDEGGVFKPQWFQYFKEPPEFDYYCASWDMTFKDSKGADYVAGGVFGVKGANKHLVYLVKEKLNFVDTIKEFLRVNALFPKMRFNLIEDKANGPAVVSTLKDKIPGIITYTPKDSKEARASAVAPQVEAGNIWLPDLYYEPNRFRYAWMIKLLPDFLEEFKNFPFGSNDDCVDMVTQLLLKIGSTPGWFRQLVEDDPTSQLSQEDQRIQRSNQVLADLMGWDIDGVGDGSGLPFNLKF